MTKDLAKEIGKHITFLKIKLKDLGMVEKSIGMFLEGRQMMDCPYCKTYNMYEIYNSGPVDNGHSMHECGKCDKTWMKQEGKW